MNKIFLKLVMLPSGLWSSMGADTEQLRAILKVRLLMDDRRPSGLGRQRAKQKKDIKYGTLLNMFFSLLIGLIYMMPLIAIHDPIFGLSIFLTLLMFFLTLMLITDFSNVLFDTRDKFILFPRPVNDKTLVLSRLLHVFIYLVRLVIPMAIPGWIVLGINYGWPSVVLFPFILVLLVFMALFFVMGCYLLLLKLVKPERFKDIINYFQIAVSIVFFASYYLLPRLFDIDKGFNAKIAAYPGLRYVPSYWLAACWSWLGYPAGLAGTKMLSVLALIFPLVCFGIMIKWLAPHFARSIGGIDAVEAHEQKVVNAGKLSSAGKSRFYQKLANLLNRTEAAKAGFMITWLQTSRSRSFKMRVYPTFAYVPVYFIFILTKHQSSFKDIFQQNPDNPSYLFLLYMCAFAMMQAINYLAISDQYKAAWIYSAAPLAMPGLVMSGAFKAMWIKYFIPFFIAISICVIAMWGPGTIVDVLLAMINVSLFAACVMRITSRYLPFSRMEQMQQSGSRIIKAFISMIIPVTLGFGHYAAIHILWLKLLFIVLSAILLWLVWDSYANTTWENMAKAEAE